MGFSLSSSLLFLISKLYKMLSWKSPLIRPLIPLLIIIYIGFIEYAFSYLFCFDHLYRHHHKSVGLGLLIVSNILICFLFFNWITILIIGPGELPCIVPPYDLDPYFNNGRNFPKMVSEIDSADTSSSNKFSSVPDIFICDSNGLPFWCSDCQTLKVLRSHHFRSLYGKCIPLMDHYCVFLGDLIGWDNYRWFFMFSLMSWIVVWFIWLNLIVYAGIWGELHAALIVLVITNGFAGLFLTNLWVNLFRCFLNGDTTVDLLDRDDRHRIMKRFKMKGDEKDLENKMEDYKKYVNVRHPSIDGIRMVLALNNSDKPFNQGFWSNIRLWFTDYKHLKTIKQVIDFETNMFSPKFRRTVVQRINNHEAKIFGALKSDADSDKLC